MLVGGQGGVGVDKATRDLNEAERVLLFSGPRILKAGQFQRTMEWSEKRAERGQEHPGPGILARKGVYPTGKAVLTSQTPSPNSQKSQLETPG